MALEIKLETAFGMDATYHKLIEVNYQYRVKSGVAVLACYKDKAARDADKTPLVTYSVVLNDILDFDAENVYKAIKLDENFAKAKDV